MRERREGERKGRGGEERKRGRKRRIGWGREREVTEKREG